MLHRFLAFTASAGFIVGSGALTAMETSRPSGFSVHMTGAKETPANTSRATGSASFTRTSTKLTYKIDVKRLSGAATAAHIHVGPAGVAGPPVYTFTVKAVGNGALAFGSIDLTKEVSAGVSGDSLVKLISSGKAYINIHTKKYPDGEIRGQLEVKP